jgi:putative addiction module component (TIGR02574 family)
VVPPSFLRFHRFGCIHRRETCGEVLAVDPLVTILAVVPWTSYNSIMKRDATPVLKEALALPVEDRAAVGEALLASLDEHCGDDAESAWKTEIERRITELDAGAVSPIPWTEVRQRLFERARRRALKRLRAGLDLQWAPMGSRDDLHRR